jgi:WD40 repeat protein
MILSAAQALAQVPPLPPADKVPLLRLETGGPTSEVTALAFSPDGKTLYAGGLDKVVRVWTLDAPSHQFVRQPGAFRVPVGPGLDGAINAIALSPDGRHLAVAGRGIVRGLATASQPGIIVPQDKIMTDDMYRDQGLIYVFDTRTRACRLLRAHHGPVLALAFAPRVEDKPPLLVAIAEEWSRAKHAFVGVARLWDVEQGISLKRSPDLAEPLSRPALAVWHSGKETDQLQAAFAWEDNLLRVWDVEANQVHQTTDGNYNTTVAYLPESGKVITGSLITDRAGVVGRLEAWDVPPGGKPKADRDLRIDLRPNGKVYFLPVALTLLSSKPGAAADLAAVVVRIPEQGEEYRLRILDLDPQNRGAVKADVSLWHGSKRLPPLVTLAAVRDGSHLAVTGNPDHRITVFSIPDLIQGQKADLTALRGVGATVGDVAFVANKNRDLGLWLSVRPREVFRQPNEDDLVFDLALSSLTAYEPGWRITEPAEDGWTVRETTGPLGLLVRRDGEDKQQIDLRKMRAITAFALLPPSERLKVPILAVACLDAKKQPLLYLYDAEHGEQLRQLTGHGTPIRALSFAANGRLLASVAEDQMVCVWSLTDLDQLVGHRGRLLGLGVTAGPKGSLVAANVPENGQDGDELQEGDVILGIRVGDNFRKPASPAAFYDAVFQFAPGTDLKLAVRDPKGQRPEHDVAMRVAQGMDERKPLFSLFLTRPARGQGRDWIGWTPSGPYDISRPRAERYLGWLFNTGQAAEPTRFGPVDQYRKDYFRGRILKYLAATGSLNEALREWKKHEIPPLPKPMMSLNIDGAGPGAPKIEDRLLLRQPPRRLTLAIDNFPANQVASVEWQIDGSPFRDLTENGLNERQADLAPLTWKRGPHEFGVRLRTKEDEPQEYRTFLPVYFIPKAPMLQLAAPPRIVNNPKFDLDARAEPGLAGEALEVSLRRDNGKFEPVEANKGRVRQVIELREGVNLLVLKAVHTGARKSAYEDLETTQLPLEITYVRPKAPEPPTVSLQIGPKLPKAVLAPWRAGRPVIVNTPEVLVRGKIAADDPLSAVKRDGKPSKGLKPDTRKFDFEDTLSVHPGSQVFHYEAATTRGAAKQADVEIDYRPRLPDLDLVDAGKELVKVEGKDSGDFEVRARLAWPPDPHPCDIAVFVNDNPRGGVQGADSKTHPEWAHTVPLDPGDNRIRFRLSNRWRTDPVERTLHVRYLRPPRVLKDIDRVKLEGKAAFDVIAWAETPADRKLTAAEVVVQAGDHGPEIRRIIKPKLEKAQGRVEVWRLAAEALPVERGRNTVRIRVQNDDGVTLSDPLVIDYKGEPPPRPIVELIDPRERNSTVDENLRDIHFTVRSAGPLRSVKLLRDRDELFSADVAELAKARPLYDKQLRRVPLQVGLNPLRLEAVNDGAPASLDFTISYTPKPVRVVVDWLESEDGNQRYLPAEDKPNVFPRVIDGRVRVRGRVRWLDATDEQLRKTSWVHLWVNGFQQMPVALDRPEKGSRERTFTSSNCILLNRFTDNQIMVQVPELPRAEDVVPADERKFPASHFSTWVVKECQRPLVGQRLHLLIVGMGDVDAQHLTADALKALNAEPVGKGRFQAKYFAEGILYGPVVGSIIDETKVWPQLQLIKTQIVRDAPTAKLNDVVMLYFRGKETLTEHDHFLGSSAAGIRCDQLANFFDDALGAQVLFLDVARLGGARARDKVAQWPTESHVGVFRYAWLVGDQVPDEARLLTALREATPQVATLKDVAAQFRRNFIRLSEKHPRALSFEPFHLPLDLEDMPIGDRP